MNQRPVHSTRLSLRVNAEVHFHTNKFLEDVTPSPATSLSTTFNHDFDSISLLFSLLHQVMKNVSWICCISLQLVLSLIPLYVKADLTKITHPSVANVDYPFFSNFTYTKFDELDEHYSCAPTYNAAFIGSRWLVTAGSAAATIRDVKILSPYWVVGIKVTYVDSDKKVKFSNFLHNDLTGNGVTQNYTLHWHPDFDFNVTKRNNSNLGIFVLGRADIALIEFIEPIGSHLMKLPSPLSDDEYISGRKPVIYVSPQQEDENQPPKCGNSYLDGLFAKQIRLKTTAPFLPNGTEREKLYGIKYKGDDRYQVYSFENTSALPSCSAPQGSPMHENGSDVLIAVANSIPTDCGDKNFTDLMLSTRISSVMPWILVTLDTGGDLLNGPLSDHFLKLTEEWSAIRVRHLWDATIIF